ncbi:hypothetical protein RRF57_009303 [Xylaria bambusicola]|uniref:Uncharacterized protein n=1 Tax=Xylaria bambusicola TaxID=326684 RepID=A0AAN7V2H4_9PEZI
MRREPVIVIAPIGFFALNACKIYWALVTPPKLPRDAPVVDIIHPSEEAFFRSLWFEDDLAAPDGSGRCVREASHPHPPLWLHEWLDYIFGLLTQRHRHGVIIFAHEQASIFQVLLYCVTYIKSLLAAVWARILVHETIVCQDINKF